MEATRQTAPAVDDRSRLGNRQLGVALASFLAVVFALMGVAALASDDHGHGSYELGAALLFLLTVLSIVLAVRAAQAGKARNAGG